MATLAVAFHHFTSFFHIQSTAKVNIKAVSLCATCGQPDNYDCEDCNIRHLNRFGW